MRSGLLALALLLAPPASAQTISPLATGRPVEGTLGPQDDEGFWPAPTKLYRMDVRAGEAYEVTMTSDAFGGYLEAYASDPPEVGAAFAMNGAYDEGGPARLVFLAPETGAVVVRATTFEPTAAGRFTLTAARRENRLESHALTLLGTPAAGELGDADAIQTGGSSVEAWTFRAQAGDEVTFEVVGPGGQGTDDLAFDPVLELYERADDVLRPAATPLASDDDSGPGTAPRLAYTFERAGSYVLAVRTYGPGTSGAYALTTTRGLLAAEDEGGVDGGEGYVEFEWPFDETATNQTGELATTDTREGRYYTDEWTVQADGQQPLMVHVDADDFDAYLLVGTGSGAQFQALAEDDDSGEGLDPFVTTPVPQVGRYTVRVRSYGEGATGRYTLTVQGGRDLRPAR